MGFCASVISIFITFVIYWTTALYVHKHLPRYCRSHIVLEKVWDNSVELTSYNFSDDEDDMSDEDDDDDDDDDDGASDGQVLKQTRKRLRDVVDDDIDHPYDLLFWSESEDDEHTEGEEDRGKVAWGNEVIFNEVSGSDCSDDEADEREKNTLAFEAVTMLTGGGNADVTDMYNEHALTLPQKERLARRRRVEKKQKTMLLFVASAVVYSIMISLLMEGMCTSFFPLSVTTTVTRSLEGSLCTESPCFVYSVLPQNDVSTSAIIVFHSPYLLAGVDDDNEEYSTARVEYGENNTEKGDDESEYTFTEIPVLVPVMTKFLTRYVYVAHLTDLTAGVTYKFIAGSSSHGYSKEMYFHTIGSEHKLEEGEVHRLRMVVGGDMGVNEHAAHLLAHMHALSPAPDFIVVGGDLAYDNAACACYHVYDKFLKQWTDAFVNNTLIPILPIVGNHDAGGWLRGSFSTKALYFYYFPFFVENFKRRERALFSSTKREGFDQDRLLDQGNELGEVTGPQVEVIRNMQRGGGRAVLQLEDLSRASYRLHTIAHAGLIFFALDSDQISSVEGAQRDWLEKHLKYSHSSIARTPLRMAGYHDPMYPAKVAGTTVNAERQENMRFQWVPLFDQFEVQFAYEFHNHQYKRTFPLKYDDLVMGVREEDSTNQQQAEEKHFGSSAITKRDSNYDFTSTNVSGTVYLGDGCMGVDSHGNLEEEEESWVWYLARAASRRHFILVDISRREEDDGFTDQQDPTKEDEDWDEEQVEDKDFISYREGQQTVAIIRTQAILEDGSCFDRFTREIDVGMEL